MNNFNLISSYIATIIILVITIGIGAILYFYFSGYISQLTSETEKTAIKSIVECSQEKIDIYAYRITLKDFNYRIPLKITENSGNNLNDYQILVTINTQELISQGKMRNDCGDIRFTDSDGITLLNYWIEDGCNTPNTRIWVKVPNIPVSSNKTIYLYYGNPSATSMSNPKNTMFIYEDMETPPSGNLAGSAVYDSTNKWVRLTPATTDQLGYLYYQTNPGPLGFHARFRFWAGGGTGADAVWLGVYDTDYIGTEEDVVRGGYHFTFDEYQDRICFTKSTIGNGAGIACATGITNIDNSQWHTAEIYYWKESNRVCARIYYDGNLVVNACDTSPQPNALNGIGQTIFGARTGGLTNEHRIDDIVVRKYVSPEPTISLGNEETSPIIKLTMINLGIELGKRYLIKLIYEDGKIAVRNITLDKNLSSGESKEIYLTDLPKGIIRKIEIYSIDVCPNMLVGIRSVNIEV